MLDAQDAVLVGGLGALGVDVGAELDHAAEGPCSISICWYSRPSASGSPARRLISSCAHGSRGDGLDVHAGEIHVTTARGGLPQ